MDRYAFSFLSCILLLSNMVSNVCLDDPFNLRLLRVWIFLSSKEYCDFFFPCRQLSVSLNFNYCFEAVSGNIWGSLHTDKYLALILSCDSYGGLLNSTPAH